ncbi:hypothetical protein [Neobacillus sp. SAB-20_R2A]|uniref:hypothetical protein n=1 Tax=Neobacillus sp. SAB-20_R2A TaxID=3120519 RepID=UPI003C6DD46E
MNLESSSNIELLNKWNEMINGYKLELSSFKDLLSKKQSECENELHGLVANTSISFSERSNRMLALIKEQETIKHLIDDLEKVTVDNIQI